MSPLTQGLNYRSACDGNFCTAQTNQIFTAENTLVRTAEKLLSMFGVFHYDVGNIFVVYVAYVYDEQLMKLFELHQIFSIDRPC